MLHGLLLVLKIAGIILAVLLGIVLAAAAAVLFVPVRYAADAQYDKNSGKKPVLSCTGYMAFASVPFFYGI